MDWKETDGVLHARTLEGGQICSRRRWRGQLAAKAHERQLTTAEQRRRREGDAGSVVAGGHPSSSISKGRQLIDSSGQRNGWRPIDHSQSVAGDATRRRTDPPVPID
uniref:Uncharacterized protein n=1 Tax=Plectus sambesii TaxID=2011161 RepID=A0A914WRU1_9BILA